MRIGHGIILLGLLGVVAAPFLLRPRGEAAPSGAWRLVAVSPHGEAIRYEFERGFSAWHKAQYGQPVTIEWRSIGGTTEISRYLDAQMLASFRQHWTRTLGRTWSEAIGRAAQDPRLARDKATPEQWAAREAYLDDAGTPLDCGIDVFFGGGPFDHNRQALVGNLARIGILSDEQDTLPYMPQRFRGEDYYPARLDASGRPNRAFDRWYGATLSSFGICYNVDRLAELGVERPPTRWSDLTDPVYYRKLGAADPTKSSTITKCFEMIVQQAIWEELRKLGIDEAGYAKAVQERAEDVAAAKSRGWREGLRTIMLIGANARYFTDWSNKPPIDVSTGDAAVGMCVDFYGRFQSQYSVGADGRSRMVFLNPYDPETGLGGSSVNADPVSVLRMNVERDTDRPYRHELARRFVAYCLDPASQRLWMYRAGAPGGPIRYTQRRIATRTDFYTEENRAHMADPDLNPYQMKEFLHYHEEWTSPLFNSLRVLIRCMCLDALEELRGGWEAILAAGGPDARPDALAALTKLPTFEVTVGGKTVEVSLEYGAGMEQFGRLLRRDAVTQLEVTERLTLAFRQQYEEAQRLAARGPAMTESER